MSRIFVSYRRALSHYSIALLKRWLTEHFGARGFFLDTENIHPGDTFPLHIQKAVSNCDVFLPLFGKGWESQTNANGQVRIHQPGDWVRREIAIALERHQAGVSGQSRPILLVPLIETGAARPSVANLPEELAGLAMIDSLPFDNEQSLDALLPLIDTGLGGAPMGKFSMRVLDQAHDPSCCDSYRFRYARTLEDLALFVDLSDHEATIANAHPELTRDDRFQLYKNWAQWSAPDKDRRWTEPGNGGKAFLILDQLQEDRRWLAIGVSIMLPLPLDGARHLLQTKPGEARDEDCSAVTLNRGDVTADSHRILLDTWIIRPRKTSLPHKTPRVEHDGWGRALELRHLAEFLHPESPHNYTILCEPDNRLIGRMLRDIGFQEEKRNPQCGILFAIRSPLNEERYDDGTIQRFQALLERANGLRHIPID